MGRLVKFQHFSSVFFLAIIGNDSQSNEKKLMQSKRLSASNVGIHNHLQENVCSNGWILTICLYWPHDDWLPTICLFALNRNQHNTAHCTINSAVLLINVLIMICQQFSGIGIANTFVKHIYHCCCCCCGVQGMWNNAVSCIVLVLNGKKKKWHRMRNA